MANPASELRAKAQEKWAGCTVSGRGRNWIKHQHPDDPHRFMLDAAIGAIHYGTNQDLEIETAWETDSGVWQWQMNHADYLAKAKSSFNGAPLTEWRHRASGEWVSLQAGQLEYNNDRNDVQFIASPQSVEATANDDTLIWVGAYGAGRDFTWRNDTTRFVKQLHLQTADSLPTPSAQIMGAANPVLRLAFTWAFSAGVEIYVDGNLWGGNRPTWTTAGAIEFRLSDGTVIGAFVPALVWDAAGSNPDNVLQRVRRAGGNLLVEVRVPIPWLETAAFPVVIDPTIDATVAASGDDTQVSGTTFSSTSTTPRVGILTAGGDYAKTSQRWASISGLSGATIDAAYMTISSISSAGTDCQTKLAAEDATAPTAPTSTVEFEGRTLTTAKVDWDFTTAPDNGDNNSPSLVTVIQELADDYDVTAIQIFHYDDGSATGATNVFRYRHYDASTTLCPRLHIEYTEGSAAVEGVGATTLDGITSMADGVALDSMFIHGDGLATFDNMTSQSEASVPVYGEGTTSLEMSGEALGNVPVQGQAQATLDMAGASLGQALITGQAQADLILFGESAGTVLVQGIGEALLEGVSGISTGSLELTGQAEIALDGISSTASGSVSISGVGIGAFELEGASSGAALISGQGQAALDMSSTAQGVVPVLGDASALLEGVAGTSTGGAGSGGYGVASLDGIASSAEGKVLVVGSGAGEFALEAVASGVVSVLGEGVVALDGVGSTALGNVPIIGEASALLAGVAGQSTGGAGAGGYGQASLEGIASASIGAVAISGVGIAELDMSGVSQGQVAIQGDASVSFEMSCNFCRRRPNRRRRFGALRGGSKRFNGCSRAYPCCRARNSSP
jgi:hypothetical protein